MLALYLFGKGSVRATALQYPSGHSEVDGVTCDTMHPGGFAGATGWLRTVQSWHRHATHPRELGGMAQALRGYHFPQTSSVETGSEYLP